MLTPMRFFMLVIISPPLPMTAPMRAAGTWMVCSASPPPPRWVGGPRAAGRGMGWGCMCIMGCWKGGGGKCPGHPPPPPIMLLLGP